MLQRRRAGIMGRPKKDIDVVQLEKLAALGCTTKEIAAFFEVSVDTIDRRFADKLAKGREMLKIKLRRIQMQIAERGSAAMAIFLGKNLLDQVDKIEHSGDDSNPITLNYKLGE
jgi:hypothetical protein